MLQRFLIILPRRERLSIPVVHHLSAGAHRHAGLGHSPFTRILKYLFSIKYLTAGNDVFPENAYLLKRCGRKLSTETYVISLVITYRVPLLCLLITLPGMSTLYVTSENP